MISDSGSPLIRARRLFRSRREEKIKMYASVSMLSHSSGTRLKRMFLSCRNVSSTSRLIKNDSITLSSVLAAELNEPCEV